MIPPKLCTNLNLQNFKLGASHLISKYKVDLDAQLHRKSLSLLSYVPELVCLLSGAEQCVVYSKFLEKCCKKYKDSTESELKHKLTSSTMS